MTRNLGYVIEEGSKRVRQWFREGPVVSTSPLALIEVMSTLVRKERAGELAPEDMEASLDAVGADFDRFATGPVSEAVIEEARICSRRFGLRGADTIHLAATRWIADLTAFRDGPIGLVTRDRDFGRLVFAGGQAAGILFLRVTPSTQDTVHEALARVLETLRDLFGDE